MDAHKQQHGSGSGRRTLTPMIESVAARGGRENYSFDCGGDCLSHHDCGFNLNATARGARIAF